MPSKRSSSKPVSKRKPSPKPKKPAQAAKAPPSRAEKPKKDKKPQKERAPAVESKHAFTVVGIGASAGGLEALERFFDVLPASPGAAFVIVTHQSPGHTSLLPELLARRASIPVVAAADGAQLEIDHAYVCPPGHALAIVDRRFELSGRGIQVDPLPIDHFFRTLARDQGSQAVAIVLSGNGTDGTLGIESVKQANGLTMAQDPATASFTGMPSSAIASQQVDFILPPGQLASEVVRVVRARPLVFREDDLSGSLRRVMSVLRQRTGSDFSAYKKSTILRRIERRMAMHGVSRPNDYARLLERAPYEVDALFKDVLIRVTSFFRDPDAFAVMERQLLELVSRMPDDAVLRGWVAGCATGEEAYSLAILVREIMQRVGKPLKAQIFATDLDQSAIDTARAGLYPAAIAQDLTPERLQRFFTKEDNGYRVNKDVREMLIFATQSVVRDPPFTKLDFVSCRNLLIYLESDLQKRVVALFAYSLAPGGILMLGTSESISGFDDRFAMLDKKWKVFARRESSRPLAPSLAFPADTPPMSALYRAPPPRGATRTGSGMGAIAERVLLSHFTPPSAIINDRGELVYLHGRTGPFLEPVSGEPSVNVFNMAREGLRLELPAAVRQAGSQSLPVVRRGLQVKTNGGFSTVTLTVQRLHDPEVLSGTFLVSFAIEPERQPDPSERRPSRGAKKQIDRIARLEAELGRTRENLQGTIEEQETSNEELKSMNEELQSTNEELQSANEELETSREEMQSLNEELHTVNAELQERNAALSQANDDMQNLLNSTKVATVFLDDRLAIKRFTSEAKKVFSLIDSDLGRPISDLTANLRYTGLVEDAAEVLRSLVSSEREIQTKDGAWRLMQIMPYRTHENLMDGLVITFVDIDRIKQAQERETQARRHTQIMVDALPQALFVIDYDLIIVSANRAFYEMFRSTPGAEIGEKLDKVGEGRWNTRELLQCVHQVILEGVSVRTVQVELQGLSGLRTASVTVRPLAAQPDAERHLLLIEVEPPTSS